MASNAWAGSNRAARLPADWQKRRRAVLQRDRDTCRHCGAKATEVDHIRPGDDHQLGNLQALCHPCHKAKTASESLAARWSPRRPPEPHPGLVA